MVCVYVALLMSWWPLKALYSTAFCHSLSHPYSSTLSRKRVKLQGSSFLPKDTSASGIGTTGIEQPSCWLVDDLLFPLEPQAPRPNHFQTIYLKILFCSLSHVSHSIHQHARQPTALVNTPMRFILMWFYIPQLNISIFFPPILCLLNRHVTDVKGW